MAARQQVQYGGLGHEVATADTVAGGLSAAEGWSADGRPPELLVSDRVQHMKLDVLRDGESLYLTYMTRPMINESWQWSRVTGVPVAVCRGAQP